MKQSAGSGDKASTHRSRRAGGSVIVRVHLRPELLAQLLAILEVIWSGTKVANFKLFLHHLDLLNRDEVFPLLVLFLLVDVVRAHRCALGHIICCAAGCLVHGACHCQRTQGKARTGKRNDQRSKHGAVADTPRMPPPQITCATAWLRGKTRGVKGIIFLYHDAAVPPLSA